MSQASSIVKYVGIGMGRQTEAYGAWYQGESAKNYYTNMQSMTLREKYRAGQEINKGLIQIGQVKQQAADAYAEAEYTRQAGDIQEENYQDETDAGLSRMYANTAKSGVDMSFGSPLEYIGKAIDDRSKGFAQLQWENDYNAYKKEREAAAISDKATIMLHDVNIAQSNMDMYDYQYLAYGVEAREAKYAAKFGEFSAYLGAVKDVFG